ncbi:autotransporter domain-containing protein [Bosea sp. Leaf344]|uniref:autotransporter domain-containing protein n=1 Tax=Bosea sp. Leaf344 TaxID=1736346 RepID=UPI0009EA864A|nr:autotransporter domain-containing protein [Bosea sp. Leaf344]
MSLRLRRKPCPVPAVHRPPRARWAAGLASLSLGLAMLGGGAAQADSFVKADGTTTSDLAAAVASWKQSLQGAARADLSLMNAEYAYARGLTGTGLRIGVIDTGTYRANPMFSAPGKLISIDVSGSRSVADVNDYAKAGDRFTLRGDDPTTSPRVLNHGSHVAGIAAGARTSSAPTHGVAFGATIVSGNSALTGEPATFPVAGRDTAIFSPIYKGMIDQNVRIINQSWGNGSFWRSMGLVARSFYEAPAGSSLDAAVAAAQSGALMVWSAGNGTAKSMPHIFAGLPHFRPELEKAWIAVTATGPDAKPGIYSGQCRYAKYWCLTAPGTKILSATGPTSFGLDSGTSMAAPMVSGALALLMERYPYLGNAEIRTILLTTAAQQGGTPGVPNEVTGWGMVDLRKGMDGPAQLLGRFNANLPGGSADLWKNDISETALAARKQEDQAEIAGAPARKQALLAELAEVPPLGSVPDEERDGIIRTNNRIRADIEAIDAHLPMLARKTDADYVGSLVKSGDGRLVLAGNNSYSGGTILEGGTLGLGSATALGTGPLAMRHLTTLHAAADGLSVANTLRIGGVGQIDTAGFGLTLAGTVTDDASAGHLFKIGAGTLTLSGVSSYSGETRITAGTLALAGAGSIARSARIYSEAGGTFDIAAKTGGAQVASLAGSGAVKLGAQTLTLTAAADDFAGTISGDGGVTVSGGAQKLSGSNAYTGLTRVDGGLLSVDGSITASRQVLVDAGGALGGNGIVGDTRIRSAGVLAPGNGIGRLTVRGDLGMDPGSIYLVEVEKSRSDLTLVTGKALVQDAIVAPRASSTADAVREHYTILTAANGVVGRFVPKVASYLPGAFVPTLRYDARNAYLDLNLDYAAALGPLSPRQGQLAGLLTDFFNRTGSIPLGFGQLTALGLSQATGESNLAAQGNSAVATTQFLGALNDGVPGERGVPIAPGPGGYTAYASSRSSGSDRPVAKTQLTADPDLWRWSVWGSGFGGVQFNGANGPANTAATTNRVYGAAVGADYRLSPETTLGFALGGAGTSFNSFGLGSGSSSLFQAGAFIRQQFGRSHIAASASYGWQEITTDRYLPGEHLQGSFHANSYAARLEAGHRVDLAGFGLTPYAAAQFSLLSLPAYREKALSGPGIFALGFAAKDATRLRGELGLRLDRTFMLAGLPLTLRAGAALIANDKASTSNLVSFQALPGVTTLTRGAPVDRTALRSTAAAELRLSKAMTVAASFEGEFARNSHSLGGKATLRYSW